MLRDDDTMKMVGNFNVVDDVFSCHLKLAAGSGECWECWAIDSSDGEPLREQLALKCGSKHLANWFNDTFDNAKVVEQ